jgi:hypothetical protein
VSLASTAWGPPPAIAHVRNDEREDDRNFDQRDHAETGREGDCDDRQHERGNTVLEQVATPTSEQTVAPPPFERSSRRLLPLRGRRLVRDATGR